MQLTRLDRWLLEEFVHETHIYTLSPPSSIPAGVRELPKPDSPGTRFQHHFIARRSKPAEALVAVLKQNGQMFSTQILDRRAWYVPWIAPRGKSVTWRLVGIVTLCLSGAGLTSCLRYLWSNPELRENILDAIKTLKGS